MIKPKNTKPIKSGPLLVAQFYHVTKKGDRWDGKEVKVIQVDVPATTGVCVKATALLKALTAPPGDKKRKLAARRYRSEELIYIPL